MKHLVLTLHVSEKKDGEVCSDDTNVCFTYLKFDTLPTDVDMFLVFFVFLFPLLLYKTLFICCA